MLVSVNWVSFDAVGTLFRLNRPLGEIYAEVALRYGLRESDGQSLAKSIEDAFHRSFRDQPPLNFPKASAADVPELEKQWWKRLVTEVFRQAGDFPRLDDCFEELFDLFATAEPWELEPGCEALLTALKKRGETLGIVSNYDSRLHSVLRGLRIDGFFDWVILSSFAPAAKPDPEIFRYALRLTGAQPAQCLHVGDDLEDDCRAAHEAGLNTLLYRPRNRGAGGSPCRRITSLSDVVSFLI